VRLHHDHTGGATVRMAIGQPEEGHPLSLAIPTALPTLRDHLFQSSLRPRCTAMLAGLRTLIQTPHGPDR
jgi:hypothetical protein